MKPLILACVLLVAAGVSSASAQDYQRGYDAGKAACANGPASSVPGINN